MSRNIKILLALNVLVFFAFVIRLRANSSKHDQAMSQAFADEGKLFEKDDVLGPGEFGHLMSIKNGVYHSHGAISDTDLTWTIAAMRRTHRNDSSPMASAARGTISVIWSGLKDLRPAQSRKLVRAICEQLDDPRTKDTDSVVSNGLFALSRLKDPSALASIRRFAGSSDKSTRQWVQTALESFGAKS